MTTQLYTTLTCGAFQNIDVNEMEPTSKKEVNPASANAMTFTKPSHGDVPQAG